MTVLYNVIYRFDKIPSKFQWNSSIKYKKYPKFTWKHNRTQNENFDQNEQFWGYPNTWFKIILHGHSKKTNMVLVQNQAYILVR